MKRIKYKLLQVCLDTNNTIIKLQIYNIAFLGSVIFFFDIL